MSLDFLQPSAAAADLELLNLLTAPAPPKKSHYRRREAPLDPLLLAAAIAVSPQITRHHYHHDIAGGVMPDTAQSVFDSLDSKSTTTPEVKPKYASRQAPRSERLRRSSVLADQDAEKENIVQELREPLQSANNLPAARRRRASSAVRAAAATPATPVIPEPSSTRTSHLPTALESPTTIPSQNPKTSTRSSASTEPVEVRCMARTRIPTPYGHVFLHIYKNNKDNKEHLAIVSDHEQLTTAPNTVQSTPCPHFIRSKSLDAKWNDEETEMDRLIRGAYVGRLSPSSQVASNPQNSSPSNTGYNRSQLAPLVRIHSECFTGETIGSMRCDCGEQLDEALRLISLPPSTTSPGRGAVIYLRQEGRGIGLLSKIRAYNLQDMGHDTVQANLLLGHGADERRYDIAAAILRDLGLDDGLTLLTNNPDKVKSLENEGIKVTGRTSMVPRSWRAATHTTTSTTTTTTTTTTTVEEKTVNQKVVGGSGLFTQGPELDRYLRTKIERMGHMLDLPFSS